MNRYVRVLTEATIDNPTVAPFFFDVVVDGEGNVVGKHLIFAYQCFAKDRKAWSNPLVIDAGGKTDFGMGYKDSANQYGNTDLRGKRMAPGTVIRSWTDRQDGYDETFRITQVVTLVPEAE